MITQGITTVHRDIYARIRYTGLSTLCRLGVLESCIVTVAFCPVPLLLWLILCCHTVDLLNPNLNYEQRYSTLQRAGLP